MRRPRRLTEEQDALRLAGLRILARLIVRAHLASLLAEEERVGSGSEALAIEELGRLFTAVDLDE